MDSTRPNQVSLLIVCGEASGDVMAAPVLAHLRQRVTPALLTYGLGGPALAEVGFSSLATLHELSGMGFDAARKWSALVRCYRLLQRETRLRRPAAALLVGFSEFNARLGAWLRHQGIRVLWYAPPQIWAWRTGRAKRLKRSADRLALTLPFEPALWQRYGAIAEYVGHPALERVARPAERAEPREEAPLPYTTHVKQARAVALLPGSREAEVHVHWPLLSASVALLRRQRPNWSYTLIISPALSPKTQSRLSSAARSLNISASRSDASGRLMLHDIALVCSGTATLECAIAGCPPVIFFHTNKYSALVLRRMLRVSHVGLPNLLLGRRAFPELVGAGVSAQSLSRAAMALAEDLDTAARDCAEVLGALRAGLGATTPSQRVADLLHPWLT